MPALDRVVLGGTFDPPHRGHITLPRAAIAQGIARCVDLIPAALSPYKQATPPAAPQRRLEMLAMCHDAYAGGDRECIRISPIELERPGPSYTVETLQAYRQEHPQERIGLLVGSDTALGLPGWKDVAEIVAHHCVVVYMRTGDDPDQVRRAVTTLPGYARSPYASALHFLHSDLVPCASTQLRVWLAEFARSGEVAPGLHECLPPAVLEYVAAHQLYTGTP